MPPGDLAPYLQLGAALPGLGTLPIAIRPGAHWWQSIATDLIQAGWGQVVDMVAEAEGRETAMRCNDRETAMRCMMALAVHDGAWPGDPNDLLTQAAILLSRLNVDEQLTIWEACRWVQETDDTEDGYDPTWWHDQDAAGDGQADQGGPSSLII